MDAQSLVARGDITRTSPPPPDGARVPLYQGNGRFGSCYGPWGLHTPPLEGGPRPDRGPQYRLLGRTHFMHLRHFVRAKYNADYLLPLAMMHWDAEPTDVAEYRQHQSFYDGTVETSFRTAACSVSLVTWFDAVNRDLAGYRFDVEGTPPDILVAPFRHINAHYDHVLEQEFTGRVAGTTWRAEIRCMNAATALHVAADAQMEETEAGVKLRLSPGRTFVVVSANSEPEPPCDESLRRTREWWHAAWQTSGWVDLPRDDAQKVWVRSIAYILSSYNDDGTGMAPPMGLTGNGWPFPFPQDLSYVHPVLLATGRLDIARSWIEFWSARVEAERSR